MVYNNSDETYQAASRWVKEHGGMCDNLCLINLILFGRPDSVPSGDLCDLHAGFS